jgi:hypothetical protein
MRPEYIVIHHSLTKDSGTVSWAAIRSHHTKALGYRDIGYHFGIEFITNPYDKAISYETLIGRFVGDIGAHCPPRNRDGIGICMIGNFDEAPPDPKLWNKAVDLCIWLHRQFGILLTNIRGHKEEMANRTCPGKYFDMEKFRQDVYNKAWNKLG